MQKGLHLHHLHHLRPPHETHNHRTLLQRCKMLTRTIRKIHHHYFLHHRGTLVSFHLEMFQEYQEHQVPLHHQAEHRLQAELIIELFAYV